MNRVGSAWLYVYAFALMPGLAAAQMPAAKVVAQPAELRSVPATVTVVGSLEPARRSRVAAELEGKVVEMPARQGDFVEAGAVLCRLDHVSARLALAAAQARLAMLEAQLAELRAGTRKEELARYRALLDEAQAELDRWTFEMQRVERLYRDRSSNPKEFQDTEASFRSAKFTHLAAQARYDEAVAGPRVELIEQAAQSVKEQRAVVERLESDLAKLTIRAPFAGSVIQRVVEVGEWVSVGGPVVELAELDTVRCVVPAPESAYPYLKVGDAARVHVPALGCNVAGVVKHVIRQADEDARTFPVEIELPNAEQRLAGGMFVQATLTAGPAVELPAVPKDAVVEKQGVNYVAITMPDPQGEGMMGLLMAVELGAEIDQWVAVTSPNVQPGMPVIVRGNERLFPFPSPVILVDERGTPIPAPAAGGGAGGAQPGGTEPGGAAEPTSGQEG